MLPEQLQEQFIRCITQPDHDPSLFLQQLAATHLPVELQLGIYRRNFSGAIQKTLKQIYPACQRILGKDYFATLCRLYANCQPSMHHDLNAYGALFSALLAEQCRSNVLLKGYEYLADLATLEWRWHASYFSANDSLFDFKAFSQLADDDYSRLEFTLSPSLSIHQSIYPLHEIWNANRIKTSASQQYTLPDESCYLCIYRHQLSPQLNIIDAQTWLALDALDKKMNFETLCLSDKFDINTTLPGLIERGWISGFTLRD